MDHRSRSSEFAAVVLSPRWLLALLAAVIFAAACIPLGLWQWTRTQEIVDSERAALEAPVEVSTVTRPGEDVPGGDVGRTVTASGTYEGERQIFITSRTVTADPSAGDPGVWVWTPLRLDDGTAVGVVRGWIAGEDAPGSIPPAGTVTVQGILTPDERFYRDAPVADGRALSVDSLRFGGAGMRGGFILLEAQDPAPTPAPQVISSMNPNIDVAFPIRNFFYSFQWWIFGGFALFAWALLAWRETSDRIHAAAGTVTSHE
jgi:cytochrome oxidase assembly protein ShyY1